MHAEKRRAAIDVIVGSRRSRKEKRRQSITPLTRPTTAGSRSRIASGLPSGRKWAGAAGSISVPFEVANESTRKKSRESPLIGGLPVLRRDGCPQ